MALAQNILDAIESNPVIAPRGGNPCVMAPWGCQGTLPDDRLVAILADGTKVGTCADYVTHTNIVRSAGRGSEAQTIFNWVVNTYKALNPVQLDDAGQPLRTLGIERPANKVLDLRKPRRARRTAA